MSLHFLDIGKLDSESNASQKAFYRMAVVFANAYIDAIADNVKRTNKEKIAKGTILKDSPLGYINLPRDKNINPDPIVVIDETRSPFVIKAFEMYASGCYSVSEIVKVLNEAGLTHKRGKHKGKPITKTLVDRMLTTKFYYGEDECLKYNAIYKHKYPTLISKELFDKCQEVRQSRGRALGNLREELRQEETQIIDKNTQRIFLYRGMISCKHCNCIYLPEVKTKRVLNDGISIEEIQNLKDKSNDQYYHTKEYIYLRPIKRDNGCKHCRSTSEEYINTQIESVLDAIHINPELLEIIKPEIQKGLDKNSNYKKTRVSIIDEKLKDYQQKKQTLLDMRMANEITREEFMGKNDNLDKQIQDLTKEKEDLIYNTKMHKEAIIDIFTIASNIRDIYTSSDTEKKRAILKILCSNLLLDGLNLCISLKKPFHLMIENAGCTEWLPVVDKFRTFAVEILQTMGGVLPFEKERICA